MISTVSDSPLSSVTTTVYVPAEMSAMSSDEEPFDHRKVYGGVPPATDRSIPPLDEL